MVSRTFILGVMRGVGKIGGSRLGTLSCPIDLKFLPVITINLRNSQTEWADLNPQSAFLQTGLLTLMSIPKSGNHV
jgi:hypothetical protein